jgi:hypothetical protein
MAPLDRREDSNLFDWSKKRRELNARVDADAAAIIAEHGLFAYGIARDRALEFQFHTVADPRLTPENSDQVQFAIGRRQGSEDGDVATHLFGGRQ